MGVDLAYFAARDDAAAVALSSRLGGPLGWPVVVGISRVGLFRREPVTEDLGPATDGVRIRGYDPLVTMGTLESLLRSVPFEEVERDPRWGGEPAGSTWLGEDAALFTLTDTLRDALADATPKDLRAVVVPWSRTEELTGIGWDDVTIEDHLDFLTSVQRLASAAVAAGHRLYCYAEE